MDSVDDSVREKWFVMQASYAQPLDEEEEHKREKMKGKQGTKVEVVYNKKWV